MHTNDQRKGEPMDIGNVTSFQSLPFGAWFLFSRDRDAVSGIGLKAYYEISSERRDHCIGVTPDIAALKTPQYVHGTGLFQIPGGFVAPMPNRTAFHAGFNDEFPP